MIAPAHAKINLGLAVGPLRSDGRHELVTVLQRIALADTISLEAADELSVEGFAPDTLVRGALEAIAKAAGVEPALAGADRQAHTGRWRARRGQLRRRGGAAAGKPSAYETAVDRAAARDRCRARRRRAVLSQARGPSSHAVTGSVLEPLELPPGLHGACCCFPPARDKPSTAERLPRAIGGEDGIRRPRRRARRARRRQDASPISVRFRVTTSRSRRMRRRCATSARFAPR